MREVILDVRSPIFGVETWRPGERYDVVVVGVPCDLGELGLRSAAAGPSAIRAASQIFPAVGDAGWYDYERGAPILRGARIADAGDFRCDRLRGAAGLAELPGVYAALADTAELLVILGGDHSISYFMAQALSGEGVVWLDAHEDARPVAGPYPDHANVVSYLDAMDHIPAIIQYGLRGLVSHVPRARPDKRAIARTPAELDLALAAAACPALAVSIDIDVVDPTDCPAVGSPMPGGLRFADVLDAVRASRAAAPVRVLELAELAPVGDADRTAVLAATHFLLRAVSACVEAS